MNSVCRPWTRVRRFLPPLYCNFRATAADWRPALKPRITGMTRIFHKLRAFFQRDAIPVLRSIRGCLCLLLSIVTGGQPLADEPADLVLRGGKVITLEDRLPEVEAVAIRGDRIVVLGSAA